MKGKQQHDVILIGGGIMSATLGSLLKEVAPDWKITVFEKLDSTAKESSDPWNNAGTGHAALCELNYTVEKPDGSIDLSKAVKINQEFHMSLQFWSYLAEGKHIGNPQDFITPLPHMSMVQGEKNIAFLQKRYDAMSKNPLFQGMEFSADPEKLAEWIPLMMKDRPKGQAMAATWIETGTDVNFGTLTKRLFTYLENKDVAIKFNHEVYDLERDDDRLWKVKVKNTVTGMTEKHHAKFVFIGSGGGALHLLQKSDIPEGKRIGGFPVSGIFLVCKKPDIIAQHRAKVYGKAPVGAPPMSVPHLDTRLIDGQESLLFGPFAGFSPKFLKYGSMLDLPKSINSDNLITMIASGVNNASLTVYLIKQLMLSKEQRIEELRDFVPSAVSGDWELLEAGQRVQIIKDTAAGRGILQFGTEVISASDGSLAALLGASPGASVAVSVMLELIGKCFPQYKKDWEPKLKEMIPSYGVDLQKSPDLLQEISRATGQILGLRR